MVSGSLSTDGTASKYRMLTRCFKKENFNSLTEEDQAMVEEAVRTGITTLLPAGEAKTQQVESGVSIPKKRPSSSQEETEEEEEAADEEEGGDDGHQSATSMGSNIKSLPISSGNNEEQQQQQEIETSPLPQLPVNIINTILMRSASASTTAHARNVCLVNRSAYQACQGALHRIVALRSVSQFQAFVQNFVNGREGESLEQVVARQNALQSLYINNIPKDIVKSNACGAYFTLVLINARNLKRCHFEEHWSDTNR